MDVRMKGIILAIGLASLPQLQLVAARENAITPPNEQPPEVWVRNNQVMMRVKANEVTHQVGFFPKSECKIDDGLIIAFSDGAVTANRKRGVPDYSRNSPTRSSL
jgi:hypothetical protein